MSILVEGFDYLGPEKKQEVADAVEKWLEALRLLKVLTPAGIELTQVDLHIMIEGKHAARVRKPLP